MTFASESHSPSIPEQNRSVMNISSSHRSKTCYLLATHLGLCLCGVVPVMIYKRFVLITTLYIGVSRHIHVTNAAESDIKLVDYYQRVLYWNLPPVCAHVTQG